MPFDAILFVSTTSLNLIPQLDFTGESYFQIHPKEPIQLEITDRTR